MADEQLSGKYKKTIEVHGKNGVYNRVQTVGSDKNPLSSKHHGLDTIFKTPEEQNKYHEHLKSLIPHNGKFYQLHQKRYNTGYGKGIDTRSYQGATAYKLHHVEKEYKKHLDKQDKIDHSGKKKELERALYDDQWYGATQTRFTDAHKHIAEREEKPVEELHKEAKTPIGKKIISKEIESENINKEKLRQHNENMHNVITKQLKDKLENYNFKTSTIKDLNSFLNLDIRRYGIIKPDTKVILTARNGQEKERSWKQMRDWLQQQVQVPHTAGQPLPFTDMKVDFPENPHKLPQE